MRHSSEQSQTGPSVKAVRRALSTPEKALLALLLFVELWIFSGSFRKFFTQDSLFYMTRAPHTWTQFGTALLAPSGERPYGPLTVGFMALVRPFLGRDPHPYHWIPIVFHLANTLLFFFLARRILAGSTAVLGATIFWGLHSVAGWITYDITYLADFLLAFLLLTTLLLAVEGYVQRRWYWTAASVGVYVLSLLTKEAATTLPLAVWITLSLSELHKSEEPAILSRVLHSFKKTLSLTCIYLAVAIAFACLFAFWQHTGSIYTQGSNPAYDVNPSSHLIDKVRYLYWAVNLPDTLSVNHALRNRALVFGLIGGLLLLWSLVLLRRGRLTVVEWSGVIWFVGLNMPAFLLSSRLEKWSLYIPLMGLAAAFGIFVQDLRDWMPAKVRPVAGLVLKFLLMAVFGFSTSVQTRSYISASDSAYQSDLLQTCLADFRQEHPTLPPQPSLFFLPAFEEASAALHSASPIDYGSLIELDYPGSRVRILYAQKGDRLPADIGSRSDTFVFQYLDRHIYDVTRFFRSSGKMRLYIPPTFEGEVPPLIKKGPAGGWGVYREYVQILVADEGAKLTDSDLERSDLWVVQYLCGRFTDITDYYKGRRRDGSLRVIEGLEAVQYSVDTKEYYPDYSHFSTPSGTPAFFPTPERDILTQIGGSTLTIPLHRIPSGSRMRFDVSWMFDQGDGGWAEVVIKTAKGEFVVFREYMRLDPKQRNHTWKEVLVDLRPFENGEANLILKCYNDPGRNTLADWLNWRDIVIETKPSSQPH